MCELAHLFDSSVKWWFYNSNMMNTSLQNIISRQNTSLHDSEVKLLFQARQYPRFQLADFYKNGELMKKDQFLFFLHLLEKWNEEAGRRGEALSDCTFTKNQFIFSWLKSLAVLNQQHIDASLQQLFGWYNSTRVSDPQCFIKKEVPNKSHLEEWEIRNSYKSNLPLEIDSYKRRLLLHPTDADPRHPSRTTPNSPTINKQNSSVRLFQQQNNFLKADREQQEVKNYLNNYRKSKVYFYKNMAKNYYRNEFERDKLSTSSGFFKPHKEHFFPTDEVKCYRIKTTTGARPFGNASSLSKTSFPTTTSYLTDKDRTIFTGEDEGCKLLPSNINGVGLIGNPFEVKLRKKKK